jgi:probable rRNA maturation factor
MFGLQSRLLTEWQDERRRATAVAAQRRTDSAVLGAAGLEDG